MHRRLISPSIPREYARGTLRALVACSAVIAGAGASAGAWGSVEGKALADEPPASGAALPGAPAAGSNGEGDTGAAKAAFQEGSRAYGAGDYRHAAESFEAAYKLNPHPSALWNAARARQRAGDIAKAANLFARYLKDAPPSSKDRNTAQSALRQLSPKLGQLEIHAVGIDDIRVDREPIDSTTLYVNPGAHVVEGKAGDRSVQQAQTVEAGQTESVALVAPATDVPVAPPVTPKTEEVPVQKVEEHRGWSPAVVIVGGVLTTVAGGVTIVLGLVATSKKNSFEAAQASGAPTGATAQDRADGSASEVRANVALGATIGLAALTGAAALWLVDWKGRDRHVQVGVDGNQMMLRGSF